jgi:hypothetical protein
MSTAKLKIKQIAPVPVLDRAKYAYTDATGKIIFVDIDELHIRLHEVDNELDHAPSSVGDRGKFVRANESTGKIEFDSIGVVDDDLECVILKI